MKKTLPGIISLLIMFFAINATAGLTKKQYENRFSIMLNFAVRTNEYVRTHLGDEKLADYAQKMAFTNAQSAEEMTPPTKYTQMHHHFLLVLENIERSFYFLAKKQMQQYRHHQKIVRKELNILETLADRAGIEPYYFR